MQASNQANALKLSAQPDIVRNGLIDDVCGFVVEGGTLISFCDARGLRYGEIMNWIRNDDERSRRYDLAIADRKEWVEERLLQELRMLSLSDLRDAFNSDGTVKQIHEIPEHVARCIASVEVFEEFGGYGEDRELIGHTKKIKFWPKDKAIELIMRKYGMLINQHRVDISAKLEDIVSDENIIDVKPGGSKNGKEETEAAPTERVLTDERINPES